MLFHVTATHTTENCPVYHRERMPAIVAADENLETHAKELNVKIHSLLSGAPEHIGFLVLEADSPAAIARLLGDVPHVQDFKVTAVMPNQEWMAMAKEMMASS